MTLKVTDFQFTQSIDQLKELVAIASFSQDHTEASMQNLIKAAEFSGQSLKDLGFEVDLVRIDNSAPFVVAQKIINENLPTILLYSHYDIQPVEKDKWATDPFVLTERDGRLYGRGASDDKAGIIAILTTLKMYQDANIPLPVNIKVLFEGEEEDGSSHMKALLAQTADKLDAKALVVLDGLNKSTDCASLTSSTRGIVDISIEVKALNKPIHSGIGCLAADPAMALAVLVSSLANPKEIPGFMDGFTPMNQEERDLYTKNSQSPQEYLEEQGALEGTSLRGDPSASVYERIVEEPSLSITNMTAGKPRGGNSIQDSAQATINARILPGQDPEHIANSIINHLRKQTPLYDVQLHTHYLGGSRAWKADVSGGFSKLYLEALSKNFPSAVAMPCGGALPLLQDFTEKFPNIEVIVPAVEDPKTAAHSHNESQDTRVLRCAINSLAAFLEAVGGTIQDANATKTLNPPTKPQESTE